MDAFFIRRFKVMKKVGQQAHMVLYLFCIEKLLRLQNQCMSLVVSGMGWNPIRSQIF